MEFDIMCPVIAEGLHFKEESSSDSSSSNELPYEYSRNRRKYFWKGGDGNTMNEALVPQNYPKCKIKSKKEQTVCTEIRKKVRDIRYSFHNKHTTIKLTNVPVEINNILDLHRCFIQFGTITLIQAQRNSNPYCAILSFLTTDDAKNAMENARKVIPHVRANWFADVCFLTESNVDYVYADDDTCSSENTNRSETDDIDLHSDELNCTQLFNVEEENFNDRGRDKKYEQNLEILITELIRKKKALLSHQMNSMREITEKINQSEIGSNEEKILSQLLKRVQDQIHDNQNSIEHSIKQRAEYFVKRKYMSEPKPEAKPNSNRPPWITAFKAITAKCKNVKNQRKYYKNRKTVSMNNDEGSLSSNSDRAFSTYSNSSTSVGASPAKDSNFCRKTIKTPRNLHANFANARRNEQRYEREMDHLLSDDSDNQEFD